MEVNEMAAGDARRFLNVLLWADWSARMKASRT